LNVPLKSPVGRAEKKISFGRRQRDTEGIFKSFGIHWIISLRMQWSVCPLEHCRALLIYRTWETFLTSWGIITLLRNLHHVINYCYNMRQQRAIWSINCFKNHNYNFILLLLLLHLLVLRISHTMLLLVKILEGFINNMQLNNPKFLGHHIFFSHSPLRCSFSSVIHNSAFTHQHIN
jgi:hypothetical protein